jgi:SNF2 family DNA or RNA helicase
VRQLLTPYQFQKDIIFRASPLRHFAFLMDMGTGKSLTSINWVKHKWIEHGGLVDTIVFCPIIALNNWKNEFLMSTQIDPEYIGVVKGKTAKQKLAIINNPKYRILIINWESLLSGYDKSRGKKLQHTGILQALIDRQFGCAIGDEIHRIKNHKGITHKAALAVTASCQHRAILTGTPITNSILDVYAQFYFMDRGETFGNSFTEFRKYYCEDENADWASKESYFPKWVVRPYMMPEFKTKLENVSARVTTEEAVDLPDYQCIPVNIELGADQIEHYNNLKTQLVTWLKEQPDNPVIVKNALTKILRLNQITTGVMKLEDGTLHRFKENPKLDACLELVEGMEGHKVIILAIYKEDYRVIGEALAKRGIKYVEIHGDISTEDKLKAAKSFETPEINEDSPTVVIGHPRAMISVNLVGAKYKIRYSRDFNLEAYLQSNKRNLRNGAIKFHQKLIDYDLIAPETVDFKIYKSLDTKKEFASEILDNARLMKAEFENDPKCKKDLEDFLS